MSTKAQDAERFEFVDAARGIAVVFMLCMHSGDGWLLPALRQGPGWDFVRAVGGLAAPLFLWLVGVSVGLGRTRGTRPLRVDLARGVQILLLGYGLRVQMWMLDGGGYAFWYHWAAAVPLAVGYGLVFVAMKRWAAGRDPRPWLLAGIPAMTLGATLISLWIPHRWVGIFRVDVLQAIGASLLVLAPLARARRGMTPVALGLAVAVLALTPWLRSWLPGPLPVPLAAYLGRWPPDSPGAAPAGMFPLFPWLAYACVGLIVGHHWARLGASRARVSAVALTAPCALLALVTCEAWAPVREALQSWPSWVQAARVIYRLALCGMVAGLAVGASRPGALTARPLACLGRASLMVYWVHLELTFGMLGRPWVRSLDLADWWTGWALLTLLMTGLSWLWLRLRRRRLPQPSGARQDAALAA